MEKGLVFNKQRFSLNDGDGIRTIIFFKGCPLFCPWCSNPESQSMKIEKIRDATNREKFKNCGQWYNIDDLVSEVLKDEIFFNSSGGGVTFSGGEALMQLPFLIKFAKELKEYDINVAIETTGYGNSEEFLELLKYVDTVLFDLKIMNKKKSQQIIGSDNSVIIKNFELALRKTKVIPRYPYIPGYTDSKENILEIINFLKKFEEIKEVHILPYHNYGEGKYELLDRKYLLKNIEKPKDEEMNEVKEIFEKEGYKIILGG